jgi:hypothetical protein
MTPNNIKDFHRQAMDLAEAAFMAELSGDSQRACELFRQAFEHGRKAAELVANDFAAEPTRSVLHRSAASLAIDCGEFREDKDKGDEGKGLNNEKRLDNQSRPNGRR